MAQALNHRNDRPSNGTAAIGRDAEGLAERFLTRHGLTLISRNYRCRRGEIDLVMCDTDTLVFIEVRRRTSRAFGGGLASVDTRKRARLIAAAEHYIMVNRIGDDRPCRFDVVAIDGPSRQVTIEWVRGAFDA